MKECDWWEAMYQVFQVHSILLKKGSRLVYSGWCTLLNQLVYRLSTQILRNKQFKYNITGFKIPTGRRQPVGYLQVWPRIWTQNNREQIQQVARVGLEPGTAGLWVRRADHSATLPPYFSWILQNVWQLAKNICITPQRFHSNLSSGACLASL